MVMNDGLLPVEKPIIPNVDPLCTELREWIKYNPKTGELTRRKSKISTLIGAPIAITKHYDSNGYCYDKIYVNRKHYFVNAAIWCYMTGYKPKLMQPLEEAKKARPSTELGYTPVP